MRHPRDATDAALRPDDQTSFEPGLRWVPVCRLDQLPDEGTLHVDAAGHSICLARSRGLIHALLDECSHGQVALSDGDVTDGLIECWLHGSRFDLSTGEPTGPPATRPVPVYQTRVADGTVHVGLASQGTEEQSSWPLRTR